MRTSTAMMTLVSILAAAAPAIAHTNQIGSPPPATSTESAIDLYGQISEDGQDRSQFGKTLGLELRTMNNCKELEISVSGRRTELPAYILVGASRADDVLPWGDSLLVGNIAAVLEIPAGQESLSIDIGGVPRFAGQELQFYFQAIVFDDDAGFPLLTSQGVELTLRDAQDHTGVVDATLEGDGIAHEGTTEQSSDVRDVDEPGPTVY